jgi:hypothetical protein
MSFDIDSDRQRSRAALEAQGRRLQDDLGEALAAFAIALGEYASRDGNVEHANSLRSASPSSTQSHRLDAITYRARMEWQREREAAAAKEAET